VHTTPRAWRALQIVAVILPAAAFLRCVNPLAPYVPVVTNEVDNFEYQVPVNGVTITSRYMWMNTGSAASVNLQSNVTGGSATVTITDGDGALVFPHALDGSGMTSTSSGTTGNWMIVVELNNTIGTLHFTVQKQ
jgi:hypothetical protein